MNNSIRKSLAYKLIILALASAIILLLLNILINDPKRAAIGDSIQYWAAARLSIEGRNPYSPELVLNLRHQVGNFTEFPSDSISMMLYPPWTIPLLLPFGFMGFEFFRIIWLIIHIILVLISTRLIWNFYGGPTKFLWLGFLVALTFEPTILILAIGHITTLHLLGLVGFLYSIHQQKNNKWLDIAAGACISLVTIKPQLLILFLLALFFWILYQRRFLVLVGGAIAVVVSSLLSLALNPAIFQNYWFAVSQYPLGAWATPTIGGVLRLVIGYNHEWLQLLPTLLGCIWLSFYWLKRKDSWDWKEETPVIVLASVFTSAYVWTYDMVLLLLPVLQVVIILILSQQRRLVSILFFAYFFVNILVTLSHIFINEFWFFWYPAFILIWYLIGRNLRLYEHPNVEPVYPK